MLHAYVHTYMMQICALVRPTVPAHPRAHTKSPCVSDDAPPSTFPACEIPVTHHASRVLAVEAFFPASIADWSLAHMPVGRGEEAVSRGRPPHPATTLPFRYPTRLHHVTHGSHVMCRRSRRVSLPRARRPPPSLVPRRVTTAQHTHRRTHTHLRGKKERDWGQLSRRACPPRYYLTI